MPRTSPLRLCLAALASLSIASATQACTSAAPSDVETSESELGGLTSADIVGSVTSGRPTAPIAYGNPPRYRAVSFTGRARDQVDAWVRSTDGDAVAFLVDSRFKSLVTNDDGANDTHDAHLVTTLPSDGTYYIAFRERDLEPATFTVSLDLKAGAPPVAGTACPTVDAIADRSCGACGKQSTLCATGADGSTVWSEYSACQNEVEDGCVPGTTVTEACGNCGTRVKTCSQYCTFQLGACTGEPVNSCAPGSTDYTAAGCAEPETYRQRSCGAACQWSSFTTTCAEPNNPNKLVIPTAVGTARTAIYTLSPNALTKRISRCGSTSTSTNKVPYVAVEVSNPTSATATLTIYHTGATSGALPLDTVIWTYDGALPPQDDADYIACTALTDSCTAAANVCGNPSGKSMSWAGLPNVKIPPHGKILVYNVSYFAKDVGDFKLAARLDSLQ